jgi:hypothetical protein
MWRSIFIAVCIVTAILLSGEVAAQTPPPIPRNAKVFIAPMNGFETYLRDAIAAKKVPVQVVDQRDQADFEILGKSESQKASTAKKVIMWDWRSAEEASINVVNLRTSEVAFAYSFHQQSSNHGKRSSAEACAKHLKENILKDSKE